MHDISPFAAVAAGVIGAVGAGVSAVLAAGTEIAPWAQVGGTATAVGALAYVAKMLADGRLVAQPVADLIRKADEREARYERKADERERALQALLEEARDREDALRALLMQHGRDR